MTHGCQCDVMSREPMTERVCKVVPIEWRSSYRRSLACDIRFLGN